MRVDSELPFQDYVCYKVFHRKQQRWYVQLVHQSGKRTTITYAKFLMSISVGRILQRHEEVDHKDENKLNDVVSNLQILTKNENIEKHVKTLTHRRALVELECPCCGKNFVREKRQTHLSKGGKRTFCSKKCLYEFQRAPVA